jgi:hypothetical protein
MGTSNIARVIGLGLTLYGVVSFTACGSSNSPSTQTQNVQSNMNAMVNTSVSDPHTCGGPSGPFSHIYVTITDIQIHVSATAAPDDPGWVDLTPTLRNNPQQVDLLAQANNQCFLAGLGSATELQPGSYQQIRVYLADNGAAVTSNHCGTSVNCVMLTTDPNTAFPLNISSESKTGIKIPSGQIAGGQFTIAPGETKDLNVDFDACASIVAEGKSGKYRLKPVLHGGEVTATSASINGRVVDSVTGIAINGGLTVVALEQRESAGVDRVVMETVTDINGNFVFCPVPPGSYDVVVAAINAAGTAYGPTVITSVQPGNALGTVPALAEAGANTSAASINGQITTSTDTIGVPVDIVASALEPVQVSASQFMITIPLALQSMATAVLTTTAGSNCPINTDCVSYTLAVPAQNPSVGTFSNSGKQQTAPPAPGPVIYAIDAQTVIPASGGTPDCTPPRLQTTTTSSNGPLVVTPGGMVTASTLAFTGCQ